MLYNPAFGSSAVDISIKGASIFTNVGYPAAGGAILSGDSLNAFSIGPFKTVHAGTGNLVITTTGDGTPVKLNSAEWEKLSLEEGKIYTIFMNGEKKCCSGCHSYQTQLGKIKIRPG